MNKDALPLSIMRYAHSGTMLLPDDEHELIFITALEAVLTHANWQLIEYVKESTQRLELVN